MALRKIHGRVQGMKSVTKGHTMDCAITITNNSIPEDLTGSTIVVTVDADQDSATNPPLFELDITAFTDALSGYTEYTIDDTNTYSWAAGTMYWSIRYIDSAGRTYVLASGSFAVTDGVSNRIA